MKFSKLHFDICINETYECISLITGNFYLACLITEASKRAKKIMMKIRLTISYISICLHLMTLNNEAEKSSLFPAIP